MRILLSGLVIFSAIVISACSSTDDASGKVAAEETESVAERTDAVAMYRTMSIDELAAVMADRNRSYTVVNVHIPYAGEIEGTDYNAAFNDLDALTTTLPDKDAPIILYCRSGNMSEQATQALVDLGYTQVYDVPGGMAAWQSSGRMLVDR